MADQHIEKKSKTLLRTIITAIVAVALIAYAAYLLVGIYPDVLITAQDRNSFSGDSLYFSEIITHPFGLFQYIGGYLTQFFYYPAVGAGMLIAIWVASVFAGIKAFRLKGLWRSLMIVPVACLLASEVDLGYWIYCLPIPGYWFSQSVAFLCLMLLLIAANATPRRFRVVWYIVIGLVGFPVFGWMAYLFAICFALSQFRRGEEGKGHATWIDGLGIVLTAIAPLVWRMLVYDEIPDADVFSAGFPFFKTSTNTSIRPAIPFFILTGTTVFMSLGRVLPALKKIPACLTYLVVGCAASYAVWNTVFKDMNYIYEMRMTQATMNDDWQSVISIAEQTKTPSRGMVMLKNIALLNTGQLSRSFELSNDGIEIYNPDSLNLNIMHIASPLIYYNHGLVNYALRWCIEFAVPYGFTPFHLKTMARCGVATGEKELARRYTSRLHSMVFYKDWQPAPVSPVVKELLAVAPDVLDNDDNSCERYIIQSFSKNRHANSKYYNELSLLYSLIIRNPSNFWTSFYDYVVIHKGETLPTQYEEGFCLFMDQRPVNFPIKVDISPTTIQRYKEFWNVGNGYAQSGMTEDVVRETMRSDWAGTYWWFNSFGRSLY